jgi:GMP synthase (glutamine-hydrolysing) A subunit
MRESKVDILVLDFGTSTTMIVERLGELDVTFTVAPWDISAREITELNPKGIILTGSGASVLDLDSPKPAYEIYEMGIPVLGICYGFQVMTHQLGGQIVHSETPETGLSKVSIIGQTDILPSHMKEFPAWFMHADSIHSVPSDFHIVGGSENNRIVMTWHPEKKFYGTLFHPERSDMAEETGIVIDLFVVEAVMGGHLAKMESLQDAHEKSYNELQSFLETLDVETTEELDLSEKNLMFLPANIGKLINLKRLTLNRNHLTHLPAEIGNLTKLNYLAIYGGQLETLPPEIGKLINLTYLAVYGNKLKSLPPEIGNLKWLETLALDNNRLEEICPEIGLLTNVMALHLGFNEITKLPPEIGNMKSLRFAKLLYNEIKELPPEICSLENLVLLDLGNNKLQKLPPEIGNLSTLRVLNSPYNRLGNLPKEIGSLKNLAFIRLENNELNALPHELANLPLLQDLDLTGNEDLVDNADALKLLEDIIIKGTKVFI